MDHTDPDSDSIPDPDSIPDSIPDPQDWLYM